MAVGFMFILQLQLMIPSAQAKTIDAPTAPLITLLSFFGGGVEGLSDARINGLMTCPSGWQGEPLESERDEQLERSLVALQQRSTVLMVEAPFRSIEGRRQ